MVAGVGGWLRFPPAPAALNDNTITAPLLYKCEESIQEGQEGRRIRNNCWIKGNR